MQAVCLGDLANHAGSLCTRSHIGDDKFVHRHIMCDPQAKSNEGYRLVRGSQCRNYSTEEASP